MSLAQLELQLEQDVDCKVRKKDLRDVQKSVDTLFDILDVYGKLAKQTKKLPNPR